MTLPLAGDVNVRLLTQDGIIAGGRNMSTIYITYKKPIAKINNGHKISKLVVFTATLLSTFIFAAGPVTSMGVFTLSGKVICPVGLYGSPNKSVTTAPGQRGAAISLDGDRPADPASNFVGSVDFGELQDGDGTPSTASFGLRARGNTKCHISASVASYSATNLNYMGKQLNGNVGNELNFVTIGSGDVSAGPHGNTEGQGYGPRFTSGTDTLATLNSGEIGPVTNSSDTFASFSKAPSRSGNLTSSDNYVESTVTFAIPTGFAWAPADDTGTGTFSIVVQFEIFMSV